MVDNKYCYQHKSLRMPADSILNIIPALTQLKLIPSACFLPFYCCYIFANAAKTSVSNLKHPQEVICYLSYQARRNALISLTVSFCLLNLKNIQLNMRDSSLYLFINTFLTENMLIGSSIIALFVERELVLRYWSVLQCLWSKLHFKINLWTITVPNNIPPYCKLRV